MRWNAIASAVEDYSCANYTWKILDAWSANIDTFSYSYSASEQPSVDDDDREEKT